jgi:hypothetical protein
MRQVWESWPTTKGKPREGEIGKVYIYLDHPKGSGSLEDVQRIEFCHRYLKECGFT